jgi:hypothetical protein|tara:strand:+ start:252 stop:530 length:279 start_codon:yes stop_codon:yes gene_type:complete
MDHTIPGEIITTREKKKMDMNARNQYLKVLQRKYLIAKSRRDKSAILDEYSTNSHQNRKYVIRKIRSSISLRRQKEALRLNRKYRQKRNPLI